nr:glycosyltransferase [uncultured Sulfurimonas sp.]
MKQINIFHISPFPYYSGGIDTWLYQFIKDFDDKLKINLVCPRNNKVSSHISKFDLSKFINLNIMYIEEDKSGLIYSLLFRPFIYYKQLKKLKNISKASLNICLSTYPLGFTVKYLKFMKVINGKLFMSVRGCVGRDMIDLEQSYLIKRLFFLLEKYSMKNYDLLISNGEDTKNYLNKFFNYKSIVIPNAIELNTINQENNNVNINKIKKLKNEFKIITHIGTLRKIKNIDKIIQSYLIVRKEYKGKVKLIFAGKGNIKYYQQQIKNFEIEEAIFLDELCSSDVNQLLSLSDIVVNISYGCGVSNSLLESLKYKCKVISFDRDTFNQVIQNNVNGYLAKDQDIKDLANKTITALDDKSIDLDDIKDSINKYDNKLIIKQWENLLLENQI